MHCCYQDWNSKVNKIRKGVDLISGSVKVGVLLPNERGDTSTAVTPTQAQQLAIAEV